VGINATTDRNNGKSYDLEERTFKFARQIRAFIRQLPRTVSNLEDIKQLVRSSGSIGANYIEANESLGKKDFLLHIKISRKESKESRLWLRLVYVADNQELENERQRLVCESVELMNIFGAIFQRSHDRVRRKVPPATEASSF
jgi:four helix bundle protein